MFKNQGNKRQGSLCFLGVLLAGDFLGIFRVFSAYFPGISRVAIPAAIYRSAQPCPSLMSFLPVLVFFWVKNYSVNFPGRPLSGVAPANQTKERPVHELVAGAFRNQSSRCESCLFS